MVDLRKKSSANKAEPKKVEPKKLDRPGRPKIGDGGSVPLKPQLNKNR